MKHDNCQKMSEHVDEKEKEKMSGHDKEEKEKPEEMAGHEDKKEEEMSGHVDEKDEEKKEEMAVKVPSGTTQAALIVEHEEKSQTTTHTAALAESERAELEAYRLQEKLNCVNEYKLPKATLEKYRLKVSELTITELRNQLNEEFRLYVSGLRKKTTFLSLSQENDTTKRQSIKDLVEKYK
jgi:hypothetical protein